jgi:hypothetical protein
MSRVYVIHEITTNKFIERDKVMIWNTGTLADARTWSDLTKAQTQVDRLNSAVVTHGKGFNGGENWRFEIKEAKIEVVD